MGVEIGNTTLEDNVAASIKILNNNDPALSLIWFHPWEALIQLYKGHTKKSFLIRENWKIRGKLLKCSKSDK